MTICVSFGTRPELIKVAPVIRELQRRDVPVLSLFTGQHPELVAPLLDWFSVTPDKVIQSIKPGTGLSGILTHVLNGADHIFSEVTLKAVLVQGDTTSALSVGLAAFHLGFPVHHIEAGLRTHNLYRPFPEEANRKLIAQISSRHYAPTQTSRDNLAAEGISDSMIQVTGNTVVDSLNYTLDKLQDFKPRISELLDEKVMTGNVLVTVHRRESWGEGLGNVFQSLSELAKRFPDLSFWIPLHPNPKVRESVPKDFFESSQMHLLEPLEYQDSIYAIAHCDLVITDSGGIQEERVAMGKHVIVARSETDRPEGVSAGLAHLCGTDPKKLLDTSTKILNSLQKDSSPNFQNIYGDGTTSVQIVSDLISSYY